MIVFCLARNTPKCPNQLQSPEMSRRGVLASRVRQRVVGGVLRHQRGAKSRERDVVRQSGDVPIRVEAMSNRNWSSAAPAKSSAKPARASALPDLILALARLTPNLLLLRRHRTITTSPLHAFRHARIRPPTMLPQRQILRAGSRFSSPAFRSLVQRRLASTENAFVRERRAVKEHAAATTGASTPSVYVQLASFGSVIPSVNYC